LPVALPKLHETNQLTDDALLHGLLLLLIALARNLNLATTGGGLC